MRLKSLVIKGFKSFADETKITFGENLIGIVGPNGSGKSNIVDAIRWVLGEQKTSELRLESMSDVIFNGTKSRKEGRVARVVLTFDNSKGILPVAFSEVSIARILYRDGNSEYRLNNVRCRKKDITNLFVDSGIGSDSYAIISLNMVEDILHDTGGSRRMMIEQAAGISKYKIRKRETLLKLSSTEEDLNRINDLLHEIEQNMSLYEKQARRTERFNQLKSKYKELSLQIAKDQSRRIKSDLAAASKELQIAQDESRSMTIEMRKKEALLQKLKTEILVHERNLSKDQQLFNQVNEKLNTTENQKNLTKQKIVDSKRFSESIKQQLTDAAQRKLLLNDNSKGLLQKHQDLKLRRDNTQETYEKDNLRFEEASKAYNHLREQERIKNQLKADHQNQITGYQREVQEFETRIKINDQSLVDLNLKVSELDTRIENQTASVKTAHKELESVRQDLEQIKTTSNQTEQTLNELKEKQRTIHTDINRIGLEKASTENSISYTTELIERREGLSNAVKSIVESNKFDVLLLSDIFEVSDTSFTNIVELLLEDLFNYVVVPSREEAHNVIQYVRDQQLGKVGIIILDEINQLSLQPVQGDLTPVHEIITCSPEYQQLKAFLTQNLWLSQKSFKTDIAETSGTIGYVNDYITKQQGMLWGGSPDLFEGIHLGKKQMLQKLNENLDKILTNLSKLKEESKTIEESIEKHTDQLSEIKTKERDLTRMEQKANFTHFEASNKLSNLDTSKNEILEKLELIKRESEKLSHEKSAIQDILASLQEGSEPSTSDDGLMDRIDEAFEAYNQARLTKDSSQNEYFEARSQYSLLEKEMIHINQQRDEVEESMKNLEERMSKQTGLSESLLVDLDKIEDQLAGLYKDRDEAQKNMNKYEEVYFKDKGDIFELEKEIGEIRHKSTRSDDTAARANERKTQLGFDLTALSDRIRIEFNTDIKNIKDDFVPEGFNLNECIIQKEKMLNRISSYGDINPMAIETYNQIKERHEQINTEKEDILQAKSSLQETISEIESTASIKFTESLEQINKNFKEVFQALFSKDDDCKIVLLDDSNPLEARIEIIAKPKGKKPKSINLLSGGEKTLTAASFLFSLYLLKPAPFCIFDEVDAPLDDVNIQKFNKLIRNFSDESQFIVITHNKLTMAEVDVLYGVFLREQGVSGVSAVDFRGYKEAEILMAPETV